MAGSLEASHHERILLADRLHHTVLLLLLGDLVADIVEVELHVGEPLSHAGVWTLDRFIDQANAVVERVLTDVDGQPLLDIEAYTGGIDLARRVVNVDLPPAHLIRQELILLEPAPHGRHTLIEAAPRRDFPSLLVFFTHLEVNGLLTDDENLLVLH